MISSLLSLFNGAGQAFPPDIPRIYTAVAEWLACLIFILSTKRRFGKLHTVLFSCLFLAAQIGAQLLAGSLPLAYWIPGMLSAAVVMFLYIFTCCKIPIFEVGYFCVKAFIMAEFAASLEWQLYCYFLLATENAGLFFELLFVIPIYIGIFTAFYFIERRYKKNNLKVPIGIKDLVMTLIVGIAIFIMSNMSFLGGDNILSGIMGMQIFYIRTLIDLCGLILMYAQKEQRVWLHTKRELDALQNVLDRQYSQYCQSRENIELINKTYHDLKHQIGVIRAEENPEKKQSYLDKMERGIRRYEAENKTGNSVLDTVLTTKSMVCSDSGINFTCVADGTLLSFMDVMDICSIFGNALDNAIENVQRVGDMEKRIIKTAVFSHGELLMIRFENYYENTLEYDRGVLQTTKDEKFGHGYGIKSIKSVVEKYGGTIKINAKNNWFEFYILIPLKNQ